MWIENQHAAINFIVHREIKSKFSIFPNICEHRYSDGLNSRAFKFITEQKQSLVVRLTLKSAVVS